MSNENLQVVVMCGSLRKGSYNAALARTLPELAPPDMSLVPAPPHDGFPHYNHDIQEAAGFPQPVQDLAAAIRNADGLVIVSPEYNWTIPGTLKNAIDWLSRLKDQPFKDKAVALQSAATGPLGASRMQYHMRQCLAGVDALVFGKPEIIVSFAQNKFDEAGVLKDEPTREIVRLQLAAFAKFIRRVAP